MSKISIEKHYHLNGADIADCVAQIEDAGNACTVDHWQLLKTRISAEELLLNFQSRFGEEKEFLLKIRRSFGSLNLTIEVQGEPFNPLLSGDEIAEDKTYILGTLDVLPRYRYADGRNQLNSSLKIKPKLGYPAVLGIAVFLGVVIGLLGNVLPAAVTETGTVLLTSLSDMLFGIMKMSSLPVIFLCVVYGITQSGSLASFRSSGVRIMGQMFLTMACMLVLTVAAAVPLYGVAYQSAELSSESLGMLADTLFSMIPDNIVAPFLNGDNVQIILLGVLFGCAVLALEQKAGMVQEFCRQMRDLCVLIMEWIAKCLPLLIMTILILNLWDGTFSGAIANTWKIPAVILGVSLLAILLDAFRISRTKGIPLAKLFSVIAKPGLQGFITTSAILCYPQIDEALKKQLKVPEKTADIALPLSLAFFHPSLIVFGAIVLYFACQSGVPMNWLWFFSYFLICFVTSIAIPPGSGGIAALLTMIFIALGVDETLIALAYPIVIVLDYPCTAARVMLTVLEIARADRPERKTKGK